MTIIAACLGCAFGLAAGLLAGWLWVLNARRETAEARDALLKQAEMLGERIDFAELQMSAAHSRSRHFERLAAQAGVREVRSSARSYDA